MIGLRAQSALIAAGMLLVVAPPEVGTMLILPIAPATLTATLDWALPAGAFLAAPGPFAGAIIVRGSRSALLPEAVAHGALLLASPFPNCSSIRRTINDQ